MFSCAVPDYGLETSHEPLREDETSGVGVTNENQTGEDQDRKEVTNICPTCNKVCSLLLHVRC